MSKIITVKEFAELKDVSQPTANVIISFLKKEGLIKAVGIRKAGRMNARGRSAVEYECPEIITIKI